MEQVCFLLGLEQEGYCFLGRETRRVLSSSCGIKRVLFSTWGKKKDALFQVGEQGCSLLGGGIRVLSFMLKQEGCSLLSVEEDGCCFQSGEQERCSLLGGGARVLYSRLVNKSVLF